ncbi:unnamed protein product [Rotaria sp. Silwood2]|nr:unnamed protein product [Rotaria sp. Silwood2]CAF4551390.1 unnamed protein product [Rotaria sp. Silwood2]
MALSVDKRYEIVFLSHHPMGLKLDVKAVSKVVNCAKSTVQYWLNRWKESKDLSDLKRTGRPRGTTEKVDQRISDLVSNDNIATTRDIQHVLKRQKLHISQETFRRRLKESGAKFSPSISKPLLAEKHGQKRLQWAQATRDMDWNRVIFSDETTVLPNKGERMEMFSCNGFGRIYCFRENLKADSEAFA